MHDRLMTDGQWARRARYIDALISYIDNNNLSTADLYEDEWALRIDSVETVDAEFYNRTTRLGNTVAGFYPTWLVTSL